MEQEFFKLIATQGIFAALFIWLLWDTRKESKQREDKLYGVIDSLTENFNVVQDIKEDIIDIKKDVEDIKKNIDKM